MNAWEYFDKVGERRLRLKLERPLDVRLLANVIGCALISSFIGALFALFVVPIPAANKEIITYMIGQLSGFAGGIVAYHYTMTAGQKELDAKRAETTGKMADAVIAAAQAGTTGTDAANAARETADAAQNKADEIAGDKA